MSKQKSRMRCLEDIRPDRASCRVGVAGHTVQVSTELNEAMQDLCWKRSSVLTQELLGLLQGSIKTRELRTDVVIVVSISIE